eukprot:CAMPEP_0168426264 /NCGR_PEP_ID=MMETSP0228-20121227/35745_1 /TAXON_ID=133427 /ORGANISM="Protoceratium reticulatum, Strain CCCM 535 (=CCMP 1889)" /LENGTH=32 /DNA_ID= /DNA_START= /DNA_END= /DNA_ORIENTATION=
MALACKASATAKVAARGIITGSRVVSGEGCTG